MEEKVDCISTLEWELMEDIPRSQVMQEKVDWSPTLEESRVDRIATSQVQRKVIPENGDSVPSPTEMKQEQDDDNQEKLISCNEEEAKMKEYIGMNIAMNEVVTQIDTCETTSYEQKSDDKATIEENRMSADVETCERANCEQKSADKATPEESRMSAYVETCERANCEQKSDDKAILDYNEENGMSADEGYSEPGQTEQTSGSIGTGTSPDSLVQLSMIERLAAVLKQSERV